MSDIKNVVFRADGDSHRGLGHIMRCLALSEGFRKKGWQSHFVGRGAQAAELVRRSGAHWNELSNRDHSGSDHKLNRQDDVEETLRIISLLELSPLFIVDHYDIDRDWLDQVRPFVGLTCVIDDLWNRPLSCDVLLDQNWTSAENPYKRLVSGPCDWLLGPYFALLRDEFRSARSGLAPRMGRVRRVLVSFGGADPTCETEKVLQALELLWSGGLYPAVEVFVLAGSANTRTASIAEFCKRLPQTSFQYASQHMAELLMKVDLVLGAAGTSTWERACLGVPSIVVQTADNQATVVQSAVAAGITKCLGRSEKVTVEDWVRVLKAEVDATAMWARQSSNGFLLVDGNGVDRVVNFLIQGFIEKTTGSIHGSEKKAFSTAR